MRISIPSPRETPRLLARQLGYAEFIDHRTGQTSYVRRLAGNFYPRFHLYLEEKNGQLIFNLHLDQKQASYQGCSAHSGEYDGAVVEREGERIKKEMDSRFRENDKNYVASDRGNQNQD